MLRCIAATLFALVLSSQGAFAQGVQGEFAPGIGRRATIFVLDTQGVEHRGRFVRIDDRELVMLVGDDERRFGRDVITRVERAGDSLRNGAIAGAVVGGVIGLVTALLVADSPGDGILGVAINVGFYTGVGTGIDAIVQGRTLVYQRWPTAPGRQRGGTPLAVSVRW